MYYKRTKVANTIFLISASLIYLLNVLMHVFLWKTAWDDIVVNIVLPLASTVALWCISGQMKFCPFMQKRVHHPIAWNIGLAMATVLICMFFHDDMQINPVPAILPVYMLSSIPYLYGGTKEPAVAITAISCTSLFFVATLSFLEYNISALFVIIVATVALFWAFRSMVWVYDAENLTRKCAIATAAFLLAVTMFAIFAPPIKENFALAAMGGRPSLGSSHYENQQCVLLFQKANFFGAADMEIYRYSFYDRPFAAVLANYGWISYILFALTALMMLLCGGYLAKRRFHIQKFYIITAYCLIACQVIGSFVTSCGWDRLLFPETMPLMGNDLLLNGTYLFLCSLIVQVKQVTMEDDQEEFADD